MSKRLLVVMMGAMLFLVFAGNVRAASYTGGSGDGWGLEIMTNGFDLGTLVLYTGGSGDGWGADTMTNDLELGGAIVTMSSGANQSFAVGDGATAISTITITDDTSPGISNGVSIHITIPSDLRMTWDDTDLTPTFGGSASVRVGAISYTNSSKTLVITVTANFNSGDTLTISDLAFKNFFCTGSGCLELDFNSDGLVDAVDDKSLTITSCAYYGGAGDGHDQIAMTNFDVLGDMQMSVIGTNGATIADGEAPSMAKGTDFGGVGLSESMTNTFSITNAGGTTVSISGWTTNGAGAASFKVEEMPLKVASHTVSNLCIVFAPSELGLCTGLLEIANDSTCTPYRVCLQGTGESAGAISVSPASLGYTATYNGSNPSDKTFAITNLGAAAFTYTNSPTYGVGDWFTPVASNGAVGGYGSQVHTGSVDITGLDAGVYQATNTVYSPTATNSPFPFVITLTINKADQTVNFPAIADQITTNSVGLAATASSGLAVSFAVGSGPASIAGGTNLTFTGAGSVSIVASQAGDGNWNPAPDVTNTFNVSKADQTINFPVIADQITTNSVGLAATAGSGLAVSFAVGSGSASISDGTNLTFSGAGQVSIVASQAGNAMWNAAPDVTNTLNVTKAFGEVALTNLVHSYDGTAKSADTVTVPPAMTVSLTYDGVTNQPVNAGAYSISGMVVNAMYQGWTNGTLTINTATAGVYLASLSHIYDGDPKSATATTMPAGLTVTFTYAGATNQPTDGGNYAVTGTVADVNYQGWTNDTMTISMQTQMVTFAAISNQIATNTVGMSASASSGLPVVFSVVSGPGQLVGLTNLGFTGAGVVKVAASQAGSGNWAPTAVTNIVNVCHAAGTLCLTNLSYVYNGAARNAGATTYPAALPVVFTYDGNAWAPTNAGTYAVTGMIDHAVYAGTNTGTMIISKANQTIAFPQIPATYVSNSLGLAATASSGLPVTFSVASGPASLAGGTNLSFSNTGMVSVVAGQVGDSNWNAAPDFTNTFFVHSVIIWITATNGELLVNSQAPSCACGTDFGAVGVGTVWTNMFNMGNEGTTNMVVSGCTTNGAGAAAFTVVGLATNVGSHASSNFWVRFAPVAAQAYTAMVTITHNGTTNAPYNICLSGTGVNAAAIGFNSTGLVFRTAYGIDPASQTYAQTNLGEASYSYTSDVALVTGDWLSISPVGGTIDADASCIATASVAVAGLDAGAYNGTVTVYSVEATNSPLDLPVIMVISQATATVELEQLWQTYDGTARLVTTSTLPTGLSVVVTYDGNAWAPTNAGTYAVTATVDEVNYQGGATDVLTVAKATATVSLEDLLQTYDGSACPVKVSTTPSGLTVSTTYVGNAWAPTNAGSYVVTAMVNEANYQGGITDVLEIAKADQTIAFANPGAQVITGKVGLAATSTSGKAVSFAVGSGPAVIAGSTNLSFTGTGTVSIVASQAGDSNWNAAPNVTNTFSVGALPAVIGSLTVGSIAAHSSELGATISATNGSSVTERGVYWSVIEGFGDGSGTKVSETGDFGIGAFTVTVGGLPTGTTNYFKAFAVNAAGATYSTQSWFLTVPAAPHGVISTNTTLTNLYLSWQAATGATNYCVDVTNSAGYVDGYSNRLVGALTTYAVTGLNHSTWHYCVVRSENASGVSTNSSMLSISTLTEGAIGVSPTSLSYTATYNGVNPTNKAFTITNYGATAYSYTNAVTYGAGDWFIPVTSNGSLAAFDSHVHTGVVDTAGLNAGVYQATNTVYSPTATNSPVAFVVTLTLNKANQTINFPAIADQIATNRIGLAATASSGLGVSFAVGSGPASIAGATNLTFTGSGTVSIVASQAGNGNWNAAPSVTNTFNVSKAGQTINFPAIADQITTNKVGLAATASSGLGVSFAVGSGLANIAGSTNLTFTGSGTVSIVASQPGNALWAEAPSITNSFNVEKAVAEVILTNLVQSYDGTSRAAGSVTVPPGLTVAMRYNGVTNQPVNAGVYSITGTVVSAMYQGWTNGTFTVNSATAGVYLANLSHVYDGGAKSATATTMPSGLTVSITYNGGADPPTEAGAYVVTGAVVAANYEGLETGTMTIAQQTQTVSFAAISNQVATNTVGLSASASSGLTVVFSVVSGPGQLVGLTNLGFTGAGVVKVAASQAGNGNWAPAATTNTINVCHAAAVVSLTNLSYVYNGAARNAGATTYPAALPVVFTYEGSSTAPSNAGTYAVTGTVSHAIYAGTNIGTMTISKANQTIAFPQIPATYVSNTLGLAATASSGLPVSFAVASGPASLAGGTNLSFSSTGIVSIVASQGGDSNWNVAPDFTNVFFLHSVVIWITGTNGELLVNSQAPSCACGTDFGAVGVGTVWTNMFAIGNQGTTNLSLSGWTTNGSGAAVFEVVDLETNVCSGGASNFWIRFAPLAAQAYTAIVTIAHNGTTNAPYSICLSGTGVNAAAIGFDSTGLVFRTSYGVEPADQTYAQTNLGEASYSYTSDVALVTGSWLSIDPLNGMIGGGQSCTVTADVTAVGLNAGVYNGTVTVYSVEATNSPHGLPVIMVVSQAVATVQLGKLWQVYNGGVRAATVSTLPTGLSVNVTYDGNAWAPTNAGSYGVTAMVNEVNYQGGATDVLVVAKASATLTLGNLLQSYDGSARTASVSTVPAGLTVNLTYDGNAWAPTNAGTYAVTAVVSEVNYQGTTWGTLTVSRSPADVYLAGFSQIYNGTAKSVTATTMPAGLTVLLTYNGVTNQPVNAGTYAVTGKVVSADYYGMENGILTISRADQTITFPPIVAQYYTNHVGLAATALSGLPVSFAVAGGPGLISGGTNLTFTSGGAVYVEAFQPGNSNWNAAPVATNVVAVSAPVLTVLGTNGAVVTNAAPAGQSSGTDFGSLLWGSVLTNVFVVTNSGDASLSISAWTTNGENADVFGVMEMPLVLAAGAVSNLSVVFAPETSGIHTGAVAIAHNGPGSVFSLNIAGTGERHTQAALTFSPSSPQANGTTNILSVGGGSGTGAVAFSVLSGPGEIVGSSGLKVTSGTGQVVVVASKSADDLYEQADATGVVACIKGDQSITFPAIVDQALTNTFTLSADSGSGLPVAFAVESGPAVISGGTDISFTATGTVAVVASQAGDVNWNAAHDVTNSFVVFENVFYGSLSIDVTPDVGLWYISGPDNYSEQTNGVGDFGPVSVPAGTYTVRYGPLSGYRTPQVHSEVVSQGSDVVFNGRYVRLRVLCDYDGDYRSDVAVYNAVSGRWYIRTVEGKDLVVDEHWGGRGFMPMPGDYDGDGASDMAVYDVASGLWYIRTVSGTVLVYGVQWGGPGYWPVPGDYDGDGTNDLCVCDVWNGNWYARGVAGNTIIFGETWGGSGYVPVPGDFDGDGISDMAVYLDSTGKWYIRTVDSGSSADIGKADEILYGEQWGGPGYVPVRGDFDGDGVSDLAVYDSARGNWYVRTVAGTVLAFDQNWGDITFMAVSGDYNGNGCSELTVYETGEGDWYSACMTGTSVIAGDQYGGSGYVPPAGDDGKPAGLIPVYRLFGTGYRYIFEHLFTTNDCEVTTLTTGGYWTCENIAWYGLNARVGNSVPLYRLYCPARKIHHYTIDVDEYIKLVNTGAWSGENIQHYVWPVPAALRVPVYRFSYPDLSIHHFTTDEVERTALIAHPEWGYVYEGIAFYVYVCP